MSIHPEYANKILNGSKKVEFRKWMFSNAPSIVVIYSTSPVSQVVGYFTVDGIDASDPASLWGMYKEVAGIKHRDFDNYFNGVERGIAIRVGKVHKLLTPLQLEELIGSKRPPQSFRYLDSDLCSQMFTSNLVSA
ncbi:ASCH domain-containing protein [Synechococcus sp. FACHB-909]|uniref:ASCH domain-containing protein n=1 Tax=Synechococcus sp. FACHB-909 TaxID=2692863 RepID=UPI0018EFF5CF|nr:ASCH domain-containing protein [Synechococcus sp. FACHB-909]